MIAEKVSEQQLLVMDHLEALYQEELVIRKGMLSTKHNKTPGLLKKKSFGRSSHGLDGLAVFHDLRMMGPQLVQGLRLSCYKAPRALMKSLYHKKDNNILTKRLAVPNPLKVKPPPPEQHVRQFSQKQLLLRLCLAHGFFSYHQPRTRRLVLGHGNNSAAVRAVFIKRGYWKIDYFKGWTPSGLVMLEGDNKITLDPKEIDLLWTQKLHSQFIESLDQEFKPVLNLPRISGPFNFNKMLSGLFSAQDIAFADRICNEYPTHELQDHALKVLRGTPSVKIIGKPYPLQNHMKGHAWVSDKKNLYLCLHRYCRDLGKNWARIIPETYLLQADRIPVPVKSNKHWIYKPGQNSNRGRGISLFQSFQEAVAEYQKHPGGSAIIQKYIENPLLYKGRKFDLRCFVIVSNLNNVLRVYWVKEGYGRTSSQPFTLDKTDRLIHLTNDSVQSKSKRYGQYETSNKLSYRQLDAYFQSMDLKCSFLDDICPKLQSLAKVVLMAALPNLKQEKSQYEFQLFGLDFMLDNGLKPYLIEVNTNPSLCTSCPLLEKVIGGALDKLLLVAVDPLFGPSKQSREETIAKIEGLELMIDEKDWKWRNQVYQQF